MEGFGFSQFPLGADGRGVSQEGGKFGEGWWAMERRGRIWGDGQRKPRRLGDSGLWVGRSPGEGGVERPPTPSGQQTHPTPGLSSSKMPHAHVHTHGCNLHTDTHKPTYSTQTQAPSQAWRLKGQSFLSLPLLPTGPPMPPPHPQAQIRFRRH